MNGFIEAKISSIFLHKGNTIFKSFEENRWGYIYFLFFDQNFRFELPATYDSSDAVLRTESEMGKKT